MTTTTQLEANYSQLQVDYARLKELYEMQQYYIEKLVRNGARVCEGSTTITYTLPIVDELEHLGDGDPRTHLRKLRAMRKQADLTLEDVADKLFVTTSTVGKWELGQREPTYFDLERWAHVLNAKAYIIVEPNAVTT